MSAVATNRAGRSLRSRAKWRWPRGSVVLGTTPAGADVVIDPKVLSTHVHVIGASGTGKSKLLENVARQSILALDGAPKGLIVVDPHGTLVSAILRWLATYRIGGSRRIHLIDPASDDVVGFNPLRLRTGIDPAFIAQTVKNAIMQAWEDEGAKPQLEESALAIFFTLAILGWTLLESELLADIADPLGIRDFIIANIRHPQIRRFWQTLDALPAAKVEEKLGAVVRRLNAFLLPQSLRRLFSQRDHVIDFRAAMDAGDIVLIDLSCGTGRLSGDESSLLGRLLVGDIFLSCLGRPADARQTVLIIDEVQKFITRDIASILDEARKFSLSLVLAHQHLGHLREAGEHIFRSVMTNTRTKVVFGGLDDDDATLLARTVLRGTLDLQLPKRAFDRPTTIGQEYDWLRSESTSRGTARTDSSNWSVSEGIAYSQSATRSWSETLSKSSTLSTATARSETETNSRTETDQWSHTDNSASSTAYSTMQSTSRAQSTGIDQEFTSWWPSRRGRISRPGDGATINDTDASGRGRATTESSSSSAGRADTFGQAVATSYGTTRGRSQSVGYAQQHGAAITAGIAVTTGVTRSQGTNHGGGHTDTVSDAETAGRAQTLRSIYATLPTQAYTLQEQLYYASSMLGNLPVGEAIAKIGDRLPVRLKTIYIKPGWASPAQVARLKARLAALSPYVTPLPLVRERYIAHRKMVMDQLGGNSTIQQRPSSDIEIVAQDEEPPTTPPPLKDDGWG